MPLSCGPPRYWQKIELASELQYKVKLFLKNRNWHVALRKVPKYDLLVTPWIVFNSFCMFLFLNMNLVMIKFTAGPKTNESSFFGKKSGQCLVGIRNPHIFFQPYSLTVTPMFSLGFTWTWTPCPLFTRKPRWNPYASIHDQQTGIKKQRLDTFLDGFHWYLLYP